MSILLATIAAGGVAGVLGSLLGIGGGVFLVPFMNLGLGLPMRAASAVSLMTVIATSSVTSAARGRLHLVNLRLGMVLEIFTTLGGFIGILFVNRFSDRTIECAFGVTVGFVALVMVSRLERRNVIADAGDRYRCNLVAGTTTRRAVERSHIASSAGCCVWFVVRRRLRVDTRNRRRRPEGSRPERVVWRAHARRGRDQRTDGRRHGRRRIHQLLRSR